MRNRKHERATRTLSALLAVALPLLATNASAERVDFEPVVGTIQGSDIVVTPFSVVQDGPFTTLLRGTLTDLQTPAPFVNLGWAVVTEDDPNVPLVLLNEPGAVDFGLDPGNYLAIVGGVAGEDLGIGTFGFEISEIPLPPAVWLLMSALVGLGTVCRRRPT